jgi:hypothetical protein
VFGDTLPAALISRIEDRVEQVELTAPVISKPNILAKPGRRLVLGEISEETYKELKKKFEGG